MVERPSFDEALAFWRELLRSRGLSDRLVWLFAEDAQPLRPRSSGAGEWRAQRAYRGAPEGDTLVFAAYESADGRTISGLQPASPDTTDCVWRDGWNLLFDARCQQMPSDHLFS